MERISFVEVRDVLAPDCAPQGCAALPVRLNERVIFADGRIPPFDSDYSSVLRW